MDITRYAAWHPAAPLGHFVQTLWTSERSAGLAHAREWNLPSGCADLVLPLDRPALRRYADADDGCGQLFSGGLLQGAMEHPTLRDTAGASIVVGAHFAPWGLCGLPVPGAASLAGQTVAMDDLWPGFAAQLCGAVAKAGALHDPRRRLECFERMLSARLRRDTPPDPLLAWAVPRLVAGQRVGPVQRASDLSPTSFILRVRNGCGLSPHGLVALQRFRNALEQVHAGAALSTAAIDTGFADQAHLARQFQRYTGVTAGQYRRARTEHAAHMACG